ncbi:G2/M phase-specific E3 ubiquitin-protein ligase-like [Siphateles boraxobius]
MDTPNPTFPSDSIDTPNTTFPSDSIDTPNTTFPSDSIDTPNTTFPSDSMDTFNTTFPSDSMHSLASTSTSTSTAVSDTRHDLRGLLLDLQSAVDLVEPGPTANCVNVVRSRVLECALRTFSRRAFNPQQQLDVVFVDSCGSGEGSVDTGGPTREFLRLLMQELLDSKYFVGPQNSKSLALDSLGLSRGTYKVLGMIMSVCLVHGGVGPRVFTALRLYSQLSGIPAPPVNIREIYDPELHDQLDKIQRAETIAETHTAMLEASNSLHMLGALCKVSNLDERQDLVNAALTFYLEGRMEMPLKQLKEGLETLGVLNAIMEHSSIMEELFCGGPPTLSAASLLDLFAVNYSQRGTNRRALEEVAVAHWRDWIIEVEDGDAEVEVDGGDTMKVTLQNVLVFASGASAIPVFGFKESPNITFLHETTNGNRRMFPEANTCTITLKLPIGHEYKEFCQFMTSGIIQSPTFGVA